MLGNEAHASVAVSLLDPGEKADTTAATGAWVAVSDYIGDLAVISSVGVVGGGTITGKLQDATDGSGTGVGDVAGATFTAVTTSNDPLSQKIVVSANKLRSHVRYIGTIATGPANVSVVLVGRKSHTA